MERLLGKPWIWSFAGAAVVFGVTIAFTGGRGAGGMLSATLSLAVFTVIVGVAQMFVITLGPGNVDLSLPANIGLASAIAMKVMAGDDAMVPVGIAAAIAGGVAIGLANYLLIRALRIPPIIATLSASFIIQSIDISYGRGLQIKPPPGFADLTSLQVGGVSVLAVVTLIFTIGAGVVLSRTIYGRSVLAIGQNPRAAWLAGVPVERIRCLTYILAGALGGLNGALLAGYFRGASIDIGNEYLLASIAVVVIGGTSVSGGRANVPGLWGAALFLVFLQVMLNTFGTDAGPRLVLTGLVIIAVIVAAGARRKFGGARRPATDRQALEAADAHSGTS
ncbi:ABC transporter permease [Dongia sedimenti]|uniref:ABC transporter permease n=1 Tax=Dongia sedimenti TaxID=3064282 RepID=A0ABU0YUR4_9PROT|nr:ABC transporter permease [Rhodospirillaceae bacterium R-7]